MKPLNLPSYTFRINESKGQKEIFDSIRRKFLILTPEEWVRQNIIRFLIEEKKVPGTLIAVEKSLMLNQLSKRTDAVVYASSGKPLMIVECKAPQVKINQEVFEQIARYNLTLRVNYLLVTNGMEHYCAYIDFANGEFAFLEDIPDYETLKLEKGNGTTANLAGQKKNTLK